MLQAPLLIGCDVQSASKETLSILGNREVINVNQDPLGIQGRKIRSKAGLEVHLKSLLSFSLKLVHKKHIKHCSDILDISRHSIAKLS